MSNPAEPAKVRQVRALLDQSRAHHGARRLTESEAVARQALAKAERLY
jgi:hypothetical protein